MTDRFPALPEKDRPRATPGPAVSPDRGHTPQFPGIRTYSSDHPSFHYARAAPRPDQDHWRRAAARQVGATALQSGWTSLASVGASFMIGNAVW